MNTRQISTLAVLAVCGLTYVVPAGAQAPGARGKLQIDGGLVTLINDVMVPAQEAGRLMAVNVKGGESVDEDFVLAEIDNRDTLAKEKIARGELDVANAQAASEAELRLAKEGVNVSKAEYETTLDIQKRNAGAVSDTEVRKYKFQWDRAIAQVDVAQVDRVVAGLTAKVKEAQLEATANELARRRITAPFKGQVEDVKRQVGEWVQPGEPVARIVQLDRLRVKGMVYASAVSPAEVIGKPVTITISTAGERTEVVKGHINFASSIIEVTGEFRIWCDIENQKLVDPVSKHESWRIQPGSSATIEIDLDAPRAVLKAEPAKGGPTLPSTSPNTTPRTTTPPSASPPSAPGTFRSRTSLEASGVKIESLKPVVAEPAAKDGEKKDEPKPEDKGETTKSKAKER